MEDPPALDVDVITDILQRDDIQQLRRYTLEDLQKFRCPGGSPHRRRTVLHLAAHYGSSGCLKHLLETWSADSLGVLDEVGSGSHPLFPRFY